MNYISAFYNTAIDRRFEPHDDVCEDLANFVLKPVRYLFNGAELRIVRNGENIKVTRSDRDELKIKRVIISLILLAPSIILGTYIRGLSLFNRNAWERFSVTVIHNTPIERKEIHLTADKVANKSLLEDPYCRKIKNLIIHGNDEPIGPKDELNFRKIQIIERLVLHNCWLLSRSHGGSKRGLKCLYKANLPQKRSPAAALRLQGFESLFKSKSSDFPDRLETGKVRYYIRRTDPNWRGILSCRTDVYSDYENAYRKDSTEYETVTFTPDGTGVFSQHPATKDEFVAHMNAERITQLAKDKILTHQFFRENPNGVLPHVFSDSYITERCVRDVDSALEQKLSRKHWYSLEKRPRMFVCFDAPA